MMTFVGTDRRSMTICFAVSSLFCSIAAWKSDSVDSGALLRNSVATLLGCWCFDKGVATLSKDPDNRHYRVHFSTYLLHHFVYVAVLLVDPLLLWEQVLDGVMMGAFAWHFLAMISNPSRFSPGFKSFYVVHHTYSAVMFGLKFLFFPSAYNHVFTSTCVLWFTAAAWSNVPELLRSLGKFEARQSSYKKAQLVGFFLKRLQRIFAYIYLPTMSGFRLHHYEWLTIFFSFLVDMFSAWTEGRSLLKHFWYQSPKKEKETPHERSLTEIGSPASSKNSICDQVLHLVLFGTNRILALNRIGRGCALGGLNCTLAGFLGPSIWAHLLWSHTAALWGNGYNDICDYELDVKAYGQKEKGLRKCLVCGAMSMFELRCWLAILTVSSFGLIWHWSNSVGHFLVASGFYSAGLACSIIYNLTSKHLGNFSFAKAVMIDLVVSGPFVFLYLFAISLSPEYDLLKSAIVASMFMFFGLYGNFIYAIKDVATDPQSFPLLLGVRELSDGTIAHTAKSLAYFSVTSTILMGVCICSAVWVATIPAMFLILNLSYFSLQVLTAQKVTAKQYKSAFGNMVNCFLLLHVLQLSPRRMLCLAFLAILHIPLSRYYIFKGPDSLHLQFSRSSPRESVHRKRTNTDETDCSGLSGNDCREDGARRSQCPQENKKSA